MSNTSVEKAVAVADPKEKEITDELNGADTERRLTEAPAGLDRRLTRAHTETERRLTEAPINELPTQEDGPKEGVKDSGGKEDAINEKVKTKKPSWRHTCYWVSMALVAGFCMGTGCFIYASSFSGLGIVGTGTYAPGGFVFFLTIKIFMVIAHKLKTGFWVKRANSTLV